ncbi:MAG: lysophospholipid acyltransferase family protein [Pseudomonadales bacterium]|nr:lysophospholipid acyltransferase family protein [Pseudomonadales bacterium]MBO6596598.1 lysophospholipid acyltransferase family protein [Pseudomonadales bacterium]MBO6823413.1 lysophospholipid acyltransferase family protein [Pseudomonadales bacterium]
MRFVLTLLACLPRSVAQFLGGFTGRVNYALNTLAARVTRTNLELCMPEIHEKTLDQMTKRSLMETGKTMFETPSVWLGNLNRVDGWIAEVHNEEILKQKTTDGNGLLIVLPHLGNWELFNVFYRRYGEFTALYHPPRQTYLRDIMTIVRSRHGNHMVPTQRSGLMALFRALNQGETVVVLPDQVPAQGIFVDFLGQQALTDTLCARLVQKTGAKVLGIAMIRRPDGRFDVHVQGPGERVRDENIETSTLAISRLVETLLELAPEQYQWEYKRFKARPVGSPKLYRYNKAPAIH